MSQLLSNHRRAALYAITAFAVAVCAMIVSFIAGALSARSAITANSPPENAFAIPSDLRNHLIRQADYTDPGNSIFHNSYGKSYLFPDMSDETMAFADEWKERIDDDGWIAWNDYAGNRLRVGNYEHGGPRFAFLERYSKDCKCWQFRSIELYWDESGTVRRFFYGQPDYRE